MAPMTPIGRIHGHDPIPDAEKLNYERTMRYLLLEQSLAHELDRRGLIDEIGLEKEEAENIVSNLAMVEKNTGFPVALLQVKSGKRIGGFESLVTPVESFDTKHKGRTDYFSFLGMVGAWVTKVDCP